MLWPRLVRCVLLRLKNDFHTGVTAPAYEKALTTDALDKDAGAADYKAAEQAL